MHTEPLNIWPRQPKALDAYVAEIGTCTAASATRNRMTLLFAVSGLLVAGGLSEDTATDADGEADGPDGKPKKAGSVHKGGSTSSVTWRLSAATQMVLVIYPSRANTRLSRYLLTRHFIEQLELVQFVRQLV